MKTNSESSNESVLDTSMYKITHTNKITWTVSLEIIEDFNLDL